MSKVEVVPALTELTVYRETEANAGGTFVKFVCLLFSASSSPPSVSPFVPTLSSTLLLPA